VNARLPIRWRLTLWYTLLSAIGLLLLGIALYFGLRATLFENFEEQVRNETAFALNAVSAADGGLQIAPGGIDRLENDDHFVRLIDAGGQIVYQFATSLEDIPLGQTSYRQALAGESVYDVRRGSGESIGIVSQPVEINGEIAGVLQVGSTRGDVEEVLRTILLAFLIAGPILLLLAAGGGYLMSGRALAPVRQITELAATVDPTDLDARLSLDLPDDELGRLAQTFDGMLARIERGFEQQRQFTADAAHELRTPLGFMRSQVDLTLRRPRSEAEYRSALEALDGDIDRMTRLVTALLTVSRSESGQLALQRVSLDVQQLIRTTLASWQPLATERELTLVDQSTPAEVWADASLLAQLLTNLIDNAVAHTPASGSIAVGCASGDEQARFWVTDTGSGIPFEHQERVFDRFYRVDPGRARSTGGAGLGLTIARAIAEAHGGSIALTSTPGSGTRVEVSLLRMPPS
jgi:heavy metal sensor kinase